MPDTRRVFLADGDALVLSTRRLTQILQALNTAFPSLERVATYANAQNILNKSEADLEMLAKQGLGIVYLGLESGSDEILSRIHKGATAAEMVAATNKAKRAGLRISIIGILGIGGLDLSASHAQRTGQVVSQMDPDFFSMLTLMLVPGTKLHDQWRSGEFQLLKPEQMLTELRQVIEHTDGLTHCVFRTNHASNYLPLKSTLPHDKERLLQTLDSALFRGKDVLRPESWRGL